ncbi:MAG TPA: GAF and ANTAR domain-containing protein [Amycolatopsis sp.]|nr:GAF and ANTAR domain-containing protein [Amycolatopsis sp.]
MTGTQPAIARTFVELADTLVADFDLMDFLHQLTVRCHEILGVDAVGLLLADNHGHLNVMAASSEQAQILELLQLQNAEGPCLDCYRTGRALSCPDLACEAHRWPQFAREALDVGYAAVHALPMRLREEVIGGLNLFARAPGALDPDLLMVGQALADVATIGLLHERAMRARDLLTEQLQTALNSRLAIEQAKGVLAERAGIPVGEAFDLLRRYARGHNRKIHDIAQAVVNRDPVLAELAPDRDPTP